MIIGIGNDIVEIDRIKKASEKDSFLKRWFSEEELRLFESKNMKAETIAANFAAKEAFVKAVGTGFTNNLPPEEISVLRDEKGKPYIVLTGNAKNTAESFLIKKIHVSVSHSKNYASAVVLCEGND